MQIIATPAVQDLARTAGEIQDACNAVAVANFLNTVQKHFREVNNGQEACGSDIGIQNPVAIAVVNKLNHLARLEQSRLECFEAIKELAAGRNVTWSMETL